MRKIAAVLIITTCMFLSGCGFLKSLDSCKNVREYWKSHYSSEKTAADQAYKKLFEAAENGDKERFADNFTEEVRTRSDFGVFLDDFFAKYPKGLSKSETQYHAHGSSGAYDNGEKKAIAHCYYTLTFEDQRYWISMGYCYSSTKHPEELGIMYLSVMNLEGYALFTTENQARLYEDPDYEYTKEVPLVCIILGEDTVKARLINEVPYQWLDTGAKKLTEDEMRTLLNEDRDAGIKPVIEKIGEPNVATRSYAGNSYTYIYELASSDGEPLYAVIKTSKEQGRIIDAYACTADKCDYDNPLCGFKKPTTAP
ncbi:MAG: DUF5104 domain-containing protein [Ruminococcaceae bacterium]|nr:DUF5104 domain-containing protein [Oscillospiraceae bacterium]